MLNEMRVAVCGDLPTTCKALRELGISQIDNYSDGIKLWFRLRQETPYHLVLIHSPAGSGMTDLHHSYKEKLNDEWSEIPVMLLDEPACAAELDMVKATLRSMAKAQRSMTER